MKFETVKYLNMDWSRNIDKIVTFGAKRRGSDGPAIFERADEAQVVAVDAVVRLVRGDGEVLVAPPLRLHEGDAGVVLDVGHHLADDLPVLLDHRTVEPEVDAVVRPVPQVRGEGARPGGDQWEVRIWSRDRCRLIIAHLSVAPSPFSSEKVHSKQLASGTQEDVRSRSGNNIDLRSLGGSRINMFLSIKIFSFFSFIKIFFFQFSEIFI